MCTMKKAITTVHTIIVIAVLIATAGWSAYYLFNQRTMNSEISAEKIPVLAGDISDFFQNNDSLYNNAFSDKIKDIFEQNSSLTAMSIYSYDTGIEYFYSRNDQVEIKTVSDGLGKGYPGPVYKGVGFSHSIASIPLKLSGQPGSNIDCIFTVLPRGSVFYVLKISLIIVIVLFFITLLIIVMYSMSSGKKTYSSSEDEWSAEAHSDMGENLSPSSAPEIPDSGLEFNTSRETDTLNLPDDDFSIPDDSSSNEIFSGDLTEMDSGLDDFDLPSDESLDLDDLSLEDSIPDIPDEKDLLAMDHQESSYLEEDNLEDFDLPDEEFDLGDDNFDMPEDNDSEDNTTLNEAESVPENKDQSSLYNPDNGLGWEHFLEERLSLELERAASFDQDLVLILIRNSKLSAESLEQLTVLLKEKYSFSDMVFEAGPNQYAIIDPNKDLDESIVEIQDFLKKLEETINDASTTAGLSSRNGRLISGNRLIREVSSTLNKADSDNPIVGFRSDPERFREFLGKNS